MTVAFRFWTELRLLNSEVRIDKMMYICADDFGLCDEGSRHIAECVQRGALNKISVFPNMCPIDTEQLKNCGAKHLSLHINLVEGKPLSDPNKVGLLIDADGNFKHSFVGLLKLSLTKRKEFEKQVYEEIKAQVNMWKSVLPEGFAMMLDSHQHTHMIPSVFRMLMKVIKDEGLETDYLRIPAEPIKPYLFTPSLWFTYKPVNIIKVLLLKFLWVVNKKAYSETPVKTALFFGVMFSGKMDEKRVSKVLCRYIKTAQKKGRDIEVLFHPGFVEGNPIEIQKMPFSEFYMSGGRKTEYDALMKLNTKNIKEV